jgi:hypothetical protein
VRPPSGEAYTATKRLPIRPSVAPRATVTNSSTVPSGRTTKSGLGCTQVKPKAGTG